MVFSHKERFIPSDLPYSLINICSDSFCVSRSATGKPDFLQSSFPGKRCRQMNPDFPRQLDYPSSDFNDFETDGVELSRGPLSSLLSGESGRYGEAHRRQNGEKT